MPDPANQPEFDNARSPELAPEVRHNTEQDDEPSQAHTVAGEALAGRAFDHGDPLDSVKPRSANLDGDSTQDLVDHMRDMEASGRIDMGAYLGEDNMDDNEDKYGEENRLDDLPSDGS
ncbi:hypothetical protein [Qipengyuania sediminis]|uniref:hypothetical protein n=1 Tax=Qipengyuania sediminis TaxID=1532023 RepID=UPI0010599671|nr:hypothetical protein [Qipengyuania sediminis]